MRLPPPSWRLQARRSWRRTRGRGPIRAAAARAAGRPAEAVAGVRAARPRERRADQRRIGRRRELAEARRPGQPDSILTSHRNALSVVRRHGATPVSVQTARTRIAPGTAISSGASRRGPTPALRAETHRADGERSRHTLVLAIA